MTSVLGNAQAAAWLDAMITDSHGCWLALHLSDPGPTGDTSTELSGGLYKRRRILFSRPSSKSIVSTTGPVFPGLVGATITHLAVWTAFTGGALRFVIPLDTPIQVSTSGQVILAPGDVALQL